MLCASSDDCDIVHASYYALDHAEDIFARRGSGSRSTKLYKWPFREQCWHWHWRTTMATKGSRIDRRNIPHDRHCRHLSSCRTTIRDRVSGCGCAAERSGGWLGTQDNPCHIRYLPLAGASTNPDTTIPSTKRENYH